MQNVKCTISVNSCETPKNKKHQNSFFFVWGSACEASTLVEAAYYDARRSRSVQRQLRLALSDL
jgi:hypothetical protein